MTPQIDRLGKMSPVLRVSTHIYGVTRDIGGKMFNFSTKARHVTPQIDRLGKMSPVLRVSTHIYPVSKEIDVKTFIGLSFLFIEMKELCEARAKLEMSSNFQIYPGKTDDEPPI